MASDTTRGGFFGGDLGPCKHWLKVLERVRPDLAAKAKDVDRGTFEYASSPLSQFSTDC